MSIARREIGASGILVSSLMLGGNVFGWTADERASFAILDAFVSSGFNGIDTSDAYSLWVPGHVGGESEAMIGRWLRRRGRRDDVVIATKVGARPLAPGDKSKAEWTPDLSAHYILESVDAALRRLETDYIDLYQSHVDDVRTPFDETLRAYETLKSSGKVRAIGASNFPSDRLVAAVEVARSGSLPRYDSCQMCYNLLDRDIESDVEEVYANAGISLLCYSALAKGFLTGQLRTRESVETSEWHQYLHGYTNDRGFAALDALDDIAANRSATVGQIALAWLVSRPCVTAALVGINNIAQWEELAPAASLTLTAEEIALLDGITACN